jgi:hypothetical protein
MSIKPQHRHSGARILARARNPYSRSGLWIPGSFALLTPRNDDTSLRHTKPKTKRKS